MLKTVKSFLVPLVFIASFAIVSNTLVSCKKNNSENSKTAKQNALEDLNKFMEIDVVLLYQKNTISEFTSEVLNETNEKGLMHDLISFLLTEFSIPLNSLLPISVFNDVSVFLKKFASINPNNQSWQQLANLIKQINSKAYSIQKLSSEKILSNLTASNSYTEEIIRHYAQKKIEEDFEFLEQGIGKRIKDSINILKPTIELINNDTTLQALLLILSSDDFKNDKDLLEDTKSNQLFEFAINFGHFYYLLSANYIST
jgi:hypothetical protein